MIKATAIRIKLSKIYGLQSKRVIRCMCHAHKDGTCLKSTVPQSSSLFISNSVARKTSDWRVDLGLEKTLDESNLAGMRQNLRRRNSDFDLDGFLEKFREFQILGIQFRELEREKDTISERMTILRHEKGSYDHQDEVEELKIRGRLLREKMKEFNHTWWTIEEYIMLTGLRLPNDLDEQTPDSPVILKMNSIDRANSPNLDHVYIGQKEGLIKFSNVGCKAYYLFKDAAILEQSLLRHVSRKLEEFGFTSMICPDIFRSPVIEGCGMDFSESGETLLVMDDKEKHPKIEDSMYLAGASSHSIVSYLCKTRLNQQDIPIKFFTKGRNYASRAPTLSDENGSDWVVDPELMLQHDMEMNCLHPSFGLYEALQTTAFHSLVLLENYEDCKVYNNEMIDMTWQIFTDLQLPVRLVRIPAEGLHISETSRIEFQLYSEVLNKYVTTAYISNVGDYVSRRLEIMMENSNYCYITHGCVFDVTKAIASLMENYFDDDINKFVFHDSMYNLMQ